MKTRFIALVVAFGATASAQLTDYLGPGVLTRGASNIGQRSGQDVDLRFFANATGIYDTGLTPVSVDSNGNLIQVGGIYGVQAGLGAYGRHQWRRAVLGLDYTGNYRHYQGHTYYNGSNHQLALGYTYQQSRRLVFDFQTLAGSASYATSFASGLPQVYDSVVDQTTLLFDNRVNYVQGGMDTNFLLSARTVLTLGGSTYTVRRQSKALIGVNGYNLHGSLEHRLSQVTTVGVSYQHGHYDYPRAFGESEYNMIQGTFARQFGRAWTLTLAGGVVASEVQGQRRVAVDPAVARLLGITTTLQTFYRRNLLPSVNATLRYNWRYASLSFNYRRGISSGNGVYLTSQQERARVSYDYTGIRKWSFSVSGNYAGLGALGQTLTRYKQYYGGVEVTYQIVPSLNITAGYIRRHVDTASNSFRRDSSRTQIGIYFSPGEIPVSFH